MMSHKYDPIGTEKNSANKYPKTNLYFCQMLFKIQIVVTNQPTIRIKGSSFEGKRRKKYSKLSNSARNGGKFRWERAVFGGRASSAAIYLQFNIIHSCDFHHTKGELVSISQNDYLSLR